MIKIASQIKNRLLERGMSAHALEKHAGLKSSAVQNILNGRSKNPSITIIQAIAQALDCSVHDLIGEVSYENKDDNPQINKLSSSPWNLELYLEVFETVTSILKIKKINLSKEKILEIVDEVYLYAQKGNQDKPDAQFAMWIIEKYIKL